MKIPEGELSQALSEYFEQTFGNRLAGNETVSKEVKNIYKQLVSFEESEGISVIARVPFGASHLLDAVGITFQTEEGKSYELSTQGNFLVYNKIGGSELKKIQAHNREVSIRQQLHRYISIDEFLPEYRSEPISPEDFIKAYLEAVEGQSDASNKKLDTLRFISAHLAQV